METTIFYYDYIKIMENKMETTVIYYDYIKIMESKSVGVLILVSGAFDFTSVDGRLNKLLAFGV